MLNIRRQAGIRIILLYWFSFMGLSAINPFFSLYLKKVLVFTDGQPVNLMIGLLLFSKSFLSLFSSPVAGYVADRFKIENRVLLFCALFAIAGGFFIGIPSFGLIGNIGIQSKILFLGIGILLIGLFSEPVYPLINTETLEYLHARRRPATLFGRYRISGTLSWVVNTALVGMFLWLLNDMAAIMIYFCIGFGFLAVVAFSGVKAKISKVKVPWDHLKRNKPFKRLLIFCALHSFGHFGTFNFTAYFFDDHHLSFLIIGLAFAVSAIPELPVMFYSKAIIQKLGSFRMVIIGAGLMVVKNLLLAFITPLGLAGLVLAVNLLHGLGFGLWLLGVINLIDSWSHKNMRAIYMNLFNVIGINIPIAVGVLASAFVIQFLDSTLMILINMCISGSAILYFIVRLRSAAKKAK
ncbi:MAG: MFS transporter [Spirochaetales bacterium]|nr:MFS transporter [Spirochaetales bacterium]